MSKPKPITIQLSLSRKELALLIEILEFEIRAEGRSATLAEEILERIYDQTRAE